MTLQAPPFGRDTSATTQVHHGRVATGLRLLAEAAFRRLITERGSLQDDLSYGLPLRLWLSRASTEGGRLAAAAQVRSEILKDPRLSDAIVVLSEQREGVRTSWRISITATAKTLGTFELTALASDVSVELLGIS